MDIMLLTTVIGFFWTDGARSWHGRYRRTDCSSRALDEAAEYKTEMERKFFEAIKNPPPPSERLKEMVRKFGPFAFGVAERETEP